MKFSEVIGQEATKERLQQLVTANRLPHALMLCGPKGVGKMSLALAFASYILGERDGADNDSKAEAMLRHWEHPDLNFSFPVIKPKGASSDYKPKCDDYGREWREMLLKEGTSFTLSQWMTYMGAENQQAIIGVGESNDLIHKLSLKSSQGGYKIDIMWLPERMNEECANKILKLLEEPPLQTIFIMVCEEPEKLLDTIRSRVQRIDVPQIETSAIEQALVERRGIGDEDAKRIARIAGGSWLRAIGTLSADNEDNEFLELFKTLMRMAYTKDVRGLKQWANDKISKPFGREKQKRLLEYFLRMIRENFMYNFHEPELIYMTKAEEDFAKNFARFINEANVIAISEILQRAIHDIGQNANANIVFYDLALNIIIQIKQKV